MKKRLIALLVVLTMLLAGCGAAESESAVSGKVEPTKATEENTEPAEETTEPSAEETETSVSMGRLEGGTYTNEYAGYACELDSNWVFYSAEDLQDLPANVQELIADTELGNAMEDISQFTDMLAENVEEMVTINVLYQKQTMQERVAYAMMTDEEILDTTLDMQDMLIEAYEQAGMEVDSMEKVTVTFLGQERIALRTVGTMQGVPYYILQVFDYHLGQYSVTLTVNCYVEDKCEEMLELFYPVN